jgi:hypothetical protein
MSTDAPQAAEDAQQNGQQKELSLNERRDLEVLAIFLRRHMIVDGSIDQNRVADEIESTVTAAIAALPSDRSKVGISPTALMEKHFPEVPKAEDVDSDDPDILALVDAVYGKVKGEVFRVLNIMPDGVIQSRLATNGHGYVLCRMKGTRGAEELAYVSRNRKCINIDNNDPAYRAAARAEAKAAALTGMAMERVPEHGKWFQRQLKRAQQLSIQASNDVTMAALDAGDDDPADDPAGDEDLTVNPTAGHDAPEVEL